MARKPARPGGGIRWGRLIRNLRGMFTAVRLFGPLLAVIAYRFVPPPLTVLMVERMMQGHGLDHRWVPMSRMSPALPRAAIAAEDARFCSHHGFDFNAIE